MKTCILTKKGMYDGGCWIKCNIFTNEVYLYYVEDQLTSGRGDSLLGFIGGTISMFGGMARRPSAIVCCVVLL